MNVLQNQQVAHYSAKEEKAWAYVNPLVMVRNLWRHRELLIQFSKREAFSRYKGSYLGLFWSVMQPLLMLVIYTFVFSVVFKAKWGVGASSSPVDFAMTMFCGMIPFNVFSECLTKSPTMIANNPNYVKKVVFPLEVMPVSILGAALINAFVSFALLLIAFLAFGGTVTPMILLAPVMFLPIVFLSLGIGWLLSSLGVFVRDIGYSIAVVAQVLFFMTPIFYPITNVPSQFQFLMKLNPLTVIVEEFRKVVLWGQQPDWFWFSLVLVVSFILMIAGYTWFMKSRRAFADVI